MLCLANHAVGMGAPHGVEVSGDPICSQRLTIPAECYEAGELLSGMLCFACCWTDQQRRGNWVALSKQILLPACVGLSIQSPELFGALLSSAFN